MQRHAEVIRLNEKDQEDYIRCHANVWPGVLKTIGECGIRNYSIFLRSGVLFAYFEYHGSDFDADMRKMADDPETQRWWRFTSPMQSAMEDATPGEKWSPMPEVFHFDGPE